MSGNPQEGGGGRYVLRWTRHSRRREETENSRQKPGRQLGLAGSQGKLVLPAPGVAGKDCLESSAGSAHPKRRWWKKRRAKRPSSQGASDGAQHGRPRLVWGWPELVCTSRRFGNQWACQLVSGWVLHDGFGELLTLSHAKSSELSMTSRRPLSNDATAYLCPTRIRIFGQFLESAIFVQSLKSIAYASSVGAPLRAFAFLSVVFTGFDGLVAPWPPH
ncbi:hypothetical protein B0H67DRAFT_126523 [Lasiosphaeris hirsuta]|uniref:Uncharacterized protein n=1 Tax=Lasiosphaeris hirsuta TaxID=260670 RepID=A0AA40B094_9PEZI|nr:hypothetical protein B0H67DRAFT_126523 [Lasiosphaeris hirsuta]